MYSLGVPSGQGSLSRDPEVRASPRVEGPLAPPTPAVQASSALRGAAHLELRDQLPAFQPRPSAGSSGLPWAHRAFWLDAREPLSSRPGGLVGASEASLHVGRRVGHTEPGLVGTTGPDARAWAMLCECRWGPGGCAMRHCQGQLCSQWPSSRSRLGSLGCWEAPATRAQRLGAPEPEGTGHLSVGTPPRHEDSQQRIRAQLGRPAVPCSHPSPPAAPERPSEPGLGARGHPEACCTPLPSPLGFEGPVRLL